MGREERLVREEDLKCDAIPAAAYRSIDVTDQVMRRVRSSNEHRAGNRFFKRTTGAAVSSICALLLLASITVYAASEYIQIRNADGRVIVKTENFPYTLPSSIAEKMDDYRKRVRDTLAPGQMAAYYINDETILTYDRINPLKYEHLPVKYNSYGSYREELQHRMNGTEILVKEKLAEGFDYKYGEIIPMWPISAGETAEEYHRLLSLLQARALVSTDDLFIEPFSWSSALGGTIYYINNKQERLVLNMINGKGLSMSQPKEAEAEKVTMKDQEVIYIWDHDKQSHTAGWMDEKNKMTYSLMGVNKSGLSKKQFLRVVESLVLGGKE